MQMPRNMLPGIGIGLAVASLLVFNRFLTQSNTNLSPADAASGSGTTHGHERRGGHSLNVQSFADRHVEAQAQPDGTVRLFFYGSQEKQLAPIPATPMEVEVLPVGENAIPVTLAARPYPGEPPGTSSRFEGQARGLTPGAEVGLTLTLAYRGHTYRVQWRPESLVPAQYRSELDQEILETEHQASLGSHPAMPAPIANRAANDAPEATAAEKELFLTPGGKYTEADIAANGRQIAAIKYRGQMASHNRKPKPGDRLCPITETVANPRFAWTIGGKLYTFCCPPCIEEFVRQAKETPDALLPPDAYVQK